MLDINALDLKFVANLKISLISLCFVTKSITQNNLIINLILIFEN